MKQRFKQDVDKPDQLLLRRCILLAPGWTIKDLVPEFPVPPGKPGGGLLYEETTFKTMYVERICTFFIGR
jgi:hypothetical protein